MEVEEAAPQQPGAGDQQPRAPTTTISTISVHSGDTRLVIALLQSREWLQLKVLEVHPELTKLGASLKEATELQRAHDEVLVQLQSKQSPVEELLRQADQLISTQKPRAEVYAAMAESLGLAWKDVNSHLEQRKLILDLNVTYQSRAEDCLDRMRALEIACQDPGLPVEIDAVKQLLTKVHELKRLMLESLMVTLQDGKQLLEKLREISTQGTLDSRPGHIKSSADHALSQVEHWLENLHDRRRLLEIAWQTRKTQLEQCLALLLLASDLKALEEVLVVRKEALSRGSDHLGDSSASAELLLHEHKKLLPEAKDLQDKALKITKATERMISSGYFASEEATAQAYSILNLSAEYLDAIEQREALLTRAIAFFRSAHTVTTKLDQLEVQLMTTKLSASSPQLIQLHSQIAKSLEEITEAPLREGYSILETVGRGSPGIAGVKHTVEDIENRKIHLGELCTAHKEENVRVSQAFTSFLEKQNELYSWLVSIAEAFLQGHQDMGSVLAMAKDFLDLHHHLLNDLQKKGVEINGLLLTLPPILEFLDDEQREDVDQKVDALHTHWLNLKSILETRIDLALIYVKFHELAVQLAKEFDSAEEELRKTQATEDTLKQVEEKWLSIQQLYGQLQSVGKNFNEDASQVADPYLDVKRATLCVETMLEHFGGRQLVIAESWQTWQSNITIEKEFKVQWELTVIESNRTVDWVSKLDEQLYPILTSDTKSSKAIAKELEEKLQTVLPEIKRAQTEIEIRMKTAETLAQKGDTQGQKETIMEKLLQLHNKVQVIMTEYQILLQMLISFFKNLAEMEKMIENLQSQYQVTRLPNAIAEVELLLKEHEASRQAVLELFKFALNESEQIIARIRQQEPEIPGRHDIERVTVLMEEKRQAWELAWTERKVQLEQHQQLCQFDSDLHQINAALNDLSTQLSAIRGQYGESLASAKATSLAFVYFEKTIELLEQRIQTFVRTAEEMLSSEHGSSSHIERELKLLQTRWAAFHSQVLESRRLIDLSIQYFQLVEEAEEWFREGSKLLLTIARKSTTVKLPEEATQLLNEVEYFLKPGETRQDERIRQISRLAIELYGEERSKQVTLVLNENREMLDSFTVISLELSTLAKNLKAAELERERQKREQEEVDASLAAARAEAAAAKAAASAAEEARKAAEAAAKALQEAAPFLQKAEVIEAIPMPPSAPEKEEEEKRKKSPSPPPKKAKFIDETPKPEAPIFTVPLRDATIQEGEKFTFECRVTGFPMPEVIWYKDGISIQNNPDYLTTFDQGICTLTIEETFTEDSAKFTCRAGNAAGTAETNAILSVKEAEEQLSPPVFIKRLESSTAQEGSTFQLECKVEGNPLPTVQWFKNDVCIDNSPDYVITYNNGEAVLRFEEVFLEDQADYSCKATNQIGTDICSANLTVEPLEPTEIPHFITPLSNVMARAGQKIKLECEVTGLPTPELSWSHNSKPVKETRDIKVQYDGKTATLVVTEAFPKDAGVYVVTAKNIAGQATSSSNVSVKGRLPAETSDSELASDMEPIKPSIQLPLKDISIFEGKRIRLDCIIVGQPEPEVIWYHNNRPVKESTDFKLLFQGDRCSLVIEEAYLEDAGDYKVVAINSGGEASSKCTLTIKSLGDNEPATRAQLVEVEELIGVPPKFSKLLSDVLAPEGDKVTFECCVEGDPRPEVKWFLNNEEIKPSEQVQQKHDEEGNVTLTILEVSPENKGVYTVKAQNSCGEAKCFANLIVKTISSPEIKRKVVQVEEQLEAPAFLELFADRSVDEDKPTTFECVITGKPTPKVQWYLNEEPVSGKNLVVSASGDRHALAVLQSSLDDSGKVACVAENQAGKATCVATLSVKSKTPVDTSTVIAPFETEVISDQQELSSFTMQRSVFVQSSSSQVTSSSTVTSGNAEPNVKVHSFSSQSEEKFEKIGDKPAVQVQSQKTEEIFQQNKEKPVVHQQSITKVMNGVSESKETVKSISTTPVASPKPTRKSVAPRFVSPLNGKIVDQGADVILDGIVDGFPQPTVTWYKNGQDLVPKEGSVIISWELNHAKLELRNVGVKDAGRYTCKAVNSVGSASSTADVVVKKTIFPPVFGRRLQAQVAKVGERVSMDCEVTGTPDPVITWYKDGVQVLGAVPGGPFRTRIQGNSYSLIIEKAELSHSGKYTVKAVNSGGEAQCIADFLVVEPEPKADQVEPELHMTTHVTMFKDVKQEVIHKQDHHTKTTSSKVTTEQIELQPSEPLLTKPVTTEMSTSPITIVTSHIPSSFVEPIVTESRIITESTKTEKHMSIRMERTPSPAFHRPAEEPQPAKEVQIPVQIEKKPDPKPPEPVFQKPAEEPKVAKEEIIIPIRIEKKPETKEVIIPVLIEEKKDDVITLDERKKIEEELRLPEQKEPEPSPPEPEVEGIERGSISKKSALDFFVSKLNESEDDVKEKPREIVPLQTSVKQNVSQFEERKLKDPDPEPAPVLHESSEVITHFGFPSRDSPSMFMKKEEHFSSLSKTEIRGSPLPEPKHWEPVKYNTFPLQTSSTQVHSEHISSSRIEKHISQSLITSSLEEFNLQPEPPPEIGYIPKTDAPPKLKLDMSTRVKQLEESHRVLSPVEIPSGAVRIFPIKSETSTPEPRSIPATPKPEPEGKKEVEEEVFKKEIVEEVSVQKKVHLPGTGEWTYQHQAPVVRSALKEYEPITPKPWSPRPMTPVQKSSPVPDLPVEHLPAIQSPWKPSTPVPETRPRTPKPAFEPLRPTSPRPSADGIAMEKLWASRRTPEPEQVSLPVEPIRRAASPKPSELTDSFLSSSFTSTSVQETKSVSMHSTLDTRRAASPRPSAEGVAMEKLWTPQKPLEPEPIVARPVSRGTQPFEKAMSPKPSQHGLAMDKIWAHKHPDSGLKKTWPPPQSVEEKPVIPWAVKTSAEKTWPPSEPPATAMQETSVQEQIVHDVQVKTTKEQLPVKEVEIPSSTVIMSTKKEEEIKTSSSFIQKISSTVPKPAAVQSYVPLPAAPKPAPEPVYVPPSPVPKPALVQSYVPPQAAPKPAPEPVYVPPSPVPTYVPPPPAPKPAPEPVYVPPSPVPKPAPVPTYVPPPPAPTPPPQNVQHYVAEARVVHTSAMMESQFETLSTTIERTEMTSEHLEQSEIFSSTQQSLTKESSPPIVEEKGLRPSEAKKLWPPGPKEEFEFKAPPILKDTLPRKESLPKTEPIPEPVFDPFLEPGPPPEIGFAPAPPVERRQSYVETIEKDLEKDLEKEPSRHLAGAVRTIPPPPQREKSIPPPLPPKEKTAPPPPVPPKEKEARPAPKKVVEEKPFQKFPDLEPFPFKPDEPKAKPTKLPPPPKPSKFIRGEFASSDYESDIDSVHIPRKWRPYESDTEEVTGYRRVIPPALKQSRRPKSTDPEPLPPSKFDQPPQFVGPPRPVIDTVEVGKKEVKETKTEITKVTAKTETKVKKHHHHHHHHSSELKKKHSPPALKPGSPPIFVQAQVPIQSEQKKPEPVSPPKTKPDSPKSKQKNRSEFPESGYMADTDEPVHLRQMTHKYSHFKHEESSKTTVEQTTVINNQMSQQSSQQIIEPQQHRIEKPVPIRPHPAQKVYHKHSEKKVVPVVATAPDKTKKEVSSTTVLTQTATQIRQDETIANLEPFPYKIEPVQPAPKRVVGPPPPSPSKFVRGEFRESDYESDIDTRIPVKWRPYDSDADEPSYKPVRPLLTPGGSRIHSRASEVKSPTPPTEFDNPPQFGGPPRPKFEPIEKPVKLDDVLRTPEKPQKVFKPTPKRHSPIEMIVATPAIKEPEVVLQPGSPPEMGYVPPPKGSPFQNATQTETSKVMKFAEATEHSRRVVSVQQTTRVIKFGEKEKKHSAPEPILEPFPYKQEPERPRRRSTGPPPTTPKKFVPGEFRESDYESDVEGIRFKPKWTPGDSDTDEPKYRKVKPPPVTRSTSVPTRPSMQAPSPLQFDTKPVEFPSPIPVSSHPKSKPATPLEIESEQKRLKRVEEMRRRFSDSSTTSVQKQIIATQNQVSSARSQEFNIKPGEPPEFGFVPASASYVASKHMSEMTNTFKSKAQQFVDDIITDVKTVRENGHVEKQNGPPSAADENDPQAYREESRVAEYGTKHIDPDTGLIYFKYDFGYEFGIVLPGEGKQAGEGDKKKKRPQIEKKRDDDIDVPVIHEKSTTQKTLEPQTAGKVPQFKPKKFVHSKAVKWEPSESEMSEAEGDSGSQAKKRYNLPNDPPTTYQKAPHILIPPSKWDQASSSPVSLSPSLPSLSPRYIGQGPHSGTPGVDSTVSPGSSWQGLSPKKGPQGRGSTPTPPSTPSTPGSLHGSTGNLTQPRKPPTFITPLRDIAVVSGQTARFECIVQAEPPPNILWSKNGRIIENSQNYQIHYRNGVCRLTIPQAFPEDGGSYTCTATNMLGTIGTTGTLQVPGERRSVRI